MEQTLKIEIENIASFHLGNGYTVCDKSKVEHGDYMKIAHIGVFREVTWYKKIDRAAMKHILKLAHEDDGNISATQSTKALAPMKTVRAFYERMKAMNEENPMALNLLNRGDVYEIMGTDAVHVGEALRRKAMHRIVDGDVQPLIVVSSLGVYTLKRMYPNREIITDNQFQKSL